MGLLRRRRKIPVIALSGIIAARGPVSLELYAPVIEQAFALAKRGTRTLVLAIESPGGSPTQSDLIAALIRRRAETAKVTVYAVIGDVGASGGYWLACAADEIHANRLSIVGSIGVITGGFGLQKFIERYGIERRLLTAGENKARNEPFSPQRPEDVAFTRALLDDAHGMFKDWVRSRRGRRLTADEGQVFDGSYMLGDRAKALGLIDGFDDVDTLVRRLGGKRARPVWLRPKRRFSLLRRLTGAAVRATADEVEARISDPRLG